MTIFEREPFVHDPHVVYYDAVMHSPWNTDGNGHLPNKDDWSTFRYAVKDIILGVVTHRYDRSRRELIIRAYFVAEHPAFEELEPTRALMVILCSQAYQTGQSMALFFEHGIPVDVRELIERQLGEIVSGHEHRLSDELMLRLYAAISEFSPEEQMRISDQKVSLEKVCFHTYRGTWSDNQVRALLIREIPLSYIFDERPSPTINPLLHQFLELMLSAILMENYALRRLEDREIGRSWGRDICSHINSRGLLCRTEDSFAIELDDCHVKFEKDSEFYIKSLIHSSAEEYIISLEEDLRQVEIAVGGITSVVVVPLDIIDLSIGQSENYLETFLSKGMGVVIIGLTLAQLRGEIEQMLSATAAQLEDEELIEANVMRYSD